MKMELAWWKGEEGSPTFLPGTPVLWLRHDGTARGAGLIDESGGQWDEYWNEWTYCIGGLIRMEESSLRPAGRGSWIAEYNRMCIVHEWPQCGEQMWNNHIAEGVKGVD